MKKIIIASIAFLMALNVWAQSPDKMSYQAVVRSTDDNLIVTTTLGMQISILQGASNGTTVYTETHTPTTNANGLVSLEIGTGTTLDVFSDIDWSNGPYYIKTETDVTGGTNYTITGVSQVMSVPYALYAKTTTELDPKVTENFDFAEAATAGDLLQYNGGKWVKVTLSGDVTVASNGVVTIADNTIATSKLQAASVTNPKLDKSNIPLSGFGAAEDNVAMGNNKITGLADPTEGQDAVTKNYTYSKQEVDALLAQAVSEAVADLEEQIDNEPSLSIGQEYQGGIIFWLDQTGKHGLMMPGENYTPVELPWSNTNGDKGAKGDGLYAGKQNTTAIVAQTLSSGYTGNFAAKHCLDYEVADNDIIYGDWYLPSHYELNLLLIAGVNGLVTIPEFEGSTFYLLWSSTQRNNQLALVIDSLIPVYDNSDTASQFNEVWPVIPIRAF